MTQLQFSTLWDNHPTNLGNQYPCNDEAFANQCAIRQGVCLRDSGVTRSKLRSAEVCWFHDKKEMHFLRAEELANALTSASIRGLGRRKKIGDPSTFYKEIRGQTGIIFFKDYWQRENETWENRTGDHIDLWNGARTTAMTRAEGALRTYGGYTECKQIWFWEVQ